jgi:hypothetical protein
MLRASNVPEKPHVRKITTLKVLTNKEPTNEREESSDKSATDTHTVAGSCWYCHSLEQNRWVTLKITTPAVAPHLNTQTKQQHAPGSSLTLLLNHV